MTTPENDDDAIQTTWDNNLETGEWEQVGTWDPDSPEPSGPDGK